jgi:S1-C subfamily serine protease
VNRSSPHVAEHGSSLKVRTATGDLPAKLIRSDAANDLALLKVEGRFTALPVKASRGVRHGETVATVGFSNPGLHGCSPKPTKGEIGSLAGSQDDPKHFQISLPAQPGNSGGALVDARGNVVSVAKLSQRAALATTGTLAENMNCAVKSSFLLSFLESVPGLSERLKEPRPAARPFEELVSETEKATVLVLVD